MEVELAATTLMCPNCSQGMLFFVRNGQGAIVLQCDECYVLYQSLQDVAANNGQPDEVKIQDEAGNWKWVPVDLEDVPARIELIPESMRHVFQVLKANRGS